MMDCGGTFSAALGRACCYHIAKEFKMKSAFCLLCLGLLSMNFAAAPLYFPEEAPLSEIGADPARPGATEPPAGPKVRLPSVDVEQPIPLPILAQPHKDRASLADPTLEASVAAALGALTLHRAAPVPFVPINLPDPFEHSEAVRLRYPPDELPMPPPITPRTPVR
jgi:hypothetical protein